MTHLANRTTPANHKRFKEDLIVWGGMVAFPTIYIAFVVEILGRGGGRDVVRFHVVVAPFLHIIKHLRAVDGIQRLVQRTRDGRQYKYLVRSVVIHHALGYPYAFERARRIERRWVERRERIVRATPPVYDISREVYAQGGGRGVH